MNTDVSAHVGHRLTYRQAVQEEWSVEWVEDQPQMKELTDTTPLEEDHLMSLYCHQCDLYLTDYQL
jgi:hypothetical protein